MGAEGADSTGKWGALPWLVDIPRHLPRPAGPEHDLDPAVRSVVLDPLDKEVEDAGLLLREELIPDGDEGGEHFSQVVIVDDAAFKGGQFTSGLGGLGGSFLQQVVQLADATHEGGYVGAAVGDGVDT
jgi:hypothetical protein